MENYVAKIVENNPNEVITLLLFVLSAVSILCGKFLWQVKETLIRTNANLQMINTNLVAYIDKKHSEHENEISIIKSKQGRNEEILDEHGKKLDQHSERLAGIEAGMFQRKTKRS